VQPASASQSNSATTRRTIAAASGPKRYDAWMMREEYNGPVGFASEPSERRKNWIARIITAGLLLFIAWLAITRVLSPPTDPTFRPPPGQSSSLPGPL